jgi:predicted AAA+ superfamily ATPase
VNKQSLKKYLEYLEAAFLMKKVPRVSEIGKYSKRENFFKIYLTNPSLRSALFDEINSDDEMIENLVETGIFSQWLHIGQYLS